MIEFADNFEHEAGDVMDSILAESDFSPTLTPFVSLGTNDPARSLVDGPTTTHQAAANDLFQAFDDGKPSLARMKRCGMHHAEAFEL
jgi:hypothetical protein